MKPILLSRRCHGSFKRFAITCILFLMFTVTAFAQTLNVSGTVTDEHNAAMPGIVVTEKGNANKVSTDLMGKFTIRVSNAKSTLMFSYIGYKTQEVPVNGNQKLEVKMLPDNQQLDQVVVVGYGTVKKRDVTGSVGQVNVNDLQKAPVTSFDNALAGRVAGVVVSGNDGEPGALNNIVIRGSNSVTQDNSPLYVVDGFPMESADFNAINTADIETIDILKDASATAIYGARGANGVVIITTKRGEKGAPQINYNGYYGIQQIPNRMEVMSPYEYVKYQLELNSAAVARYTPGALPTTDPSYVVGGRTLEYYRNIKGIDWQDMVLQTAPMQNHDISLRGGSDATKYALSGNILKQDGVFIETGFKRSQGRLAIDQVVNKKFKISANVNYSATDNFGSQVGSDQSNGSYNLIYGLWAYRPVAGKDNIDLEEDLLDPDAAITMLSVNPLLNAQNAYRSTRSNSLIANSYAEYSFSDKLKLRVSGGITTNNRIDEIFNNSQTTRGSVRNPLGVNGSVYNFTSSTWVNENTLTYDKTFNKNHTLNVLAGITSQGNNSSSRGFSATQVPNEELKIDGLDESQNQVASSSSSRWSLASFLGRATYNYKSKYLLTASFRADGSSRFTANNKWSYFPSAAFAWRISNENFLKNISAISDSKIRASYGITGNNRIAEFSYLSQLSLGNQNAYSYNNNLFPGIALNLLGNPDLKWETTSQLNIGYDLSLFNQRVSLTADWYQKNTYDLLLNAQVPYTTGVSQAYKNIGKIRNNGFEFSLNSVNIKKPNFSWTSNFNISFNNNKLLELTENQESLLSGARFDSNFNTLFPYIAIVGQPVAQMYGLVWEGVYQYSDFNKLPNGTYVLLDNVTTNGSARANIQPGDIKYKDLNGDLVVDAADNTTIGKPLPIHTGGFSNQFTYKQFDLNVFFQWSYGNDILNANRLQLEGNSLIVRDVNQYASYIDRWSPDNQSSTNFRTNGQGPFSYSSRVIEDGSFLRLKTISLGYNMQSNSLKNIGIKRLRIYASGQNLYTWTNYSGMDPEVSVRNGNGALTPGFDYAAYPRARTIIFGINLNL